MSTVQTVVVFGTAVEEVRVVANLPQGYQSQENFEPAPENALDLWSVDVRQVLAPLVLRQAAEEDLVVFCRQLDVTFDIVFHPPQQVGVDGVTQNCGALVCGCNLE